MLTQDILNRLEKQLLDKEERFSKMIFPVYSVLKLEDRCAIYCVEHLSHHIKKLIESVFHKQQEYNSNTKEWEIVNDLPEYINDHYNKISISSAYIHVGIYCEGIDEDCDLIEWHAYIEFRIGNDVFC
jgi:hypothetical protein